MAGEFPQSTVYYFKFIQESWQEVARSQPWQSPQQIQSQLWHQWTTGSALSSTKTQQTVSTASHGMRNKQPNTTNYDTDPGLCHLLLLLPPELEAGGVSPAQAVAMAREQWAVMDEQERQAWRQAARDEAEKQTNKMKSTQNICLNLNTSKFSSTLTTPINVKVNQPSCLGNLNLPKDWKTKAKATTPTELNITKNALLTFVSNNTASTPATTGESITSTSKELKETIATTWPIKNSNDVAPVIAFRPLDPGLEQLMLLLPRELEAGGVTSAQAVTMAREKWAVMDEQEKEVWRDLAREERGKELVSMKEA